MDPKNPEPNPAPDQNTESAEYSIRRPPLRKLERPPYPPRVWYNTMDFVVFDDELNDKHD